MLRSLRQLWRHRFRSALIVASAAVGVTGVVCPVNYGASGSQQLMEQIRRMGEIGLDPEAPYQRRGSRARRNLLNDIIRRQVLSTTHCRSRPILGDGFICGLA